VVSGQWSVVSDQGSGVRGQGSGGQICCVPGLADVGLFEMEAGGVVLEACGFLVWSLRNFGGVCEKSRQTKAHNGSENGRSPECPLQGLAVYGEAPDAEKHSYPQADRLGDKGAWTVVGGIFACAESIAKHSHHGKYGRQESNRDELEDGKVHGAFSLAIGAMISGIHLLRLRR